MASGPLLFVALALSACTSRGSQTPPRPALVGYWTATLAGEFTGNGQAPRDSVGIEFVISTAEPDSSMFSFGDDAARLADHRYLVQLFGDLRWVANTPLRGTINRVEVLGDTILNLGFGEGDDRGQLAISARLYGDSALGTWEMRCDCPTRGGAIRMRRPP
jgi:hypothetical protein